MDCNDYQRLVSRLRDGELPADESTEVFRHLSACGTCREFYHALQVMDNALGRIADTLPPDSTQRFIALPDPYQTDRWWNQRVALRLPVIGILLCAIVLGLFVLLPQSSFFREPESIYVTKLPTVVVDATTAPPEPTRE